MTEEQRNAAKARVEGSPALKQLYESFRSAFKYSEDEALAATVGRQALSEPGDLFRL